ncbi:hypothetical protein AVEN_194779-1 [Araneus ventricosus]|uniref:Uncharacterized protein n=1 Tax=Araneus ventricosus TaxID=182803 RepID=A0A4Y2B5E4_ARAVE|nr:hypothetical protein AVEN_194779-1 [Araneus ventricosus]
MNTAEFQKIIFSQLLLSETIEYKKLRSRYTGFEHRPNVFKQDNEVPERIFAALLVSKLTSLHCQGRWFHGRHFSLEMSGTIASDNSKGQSGERFLVYHGQVNPMSPIAPQTARSTEAGPADFGRQCECFRKNVVPFFVDNLWGNHRCRPPGISVKNVTIPFCFYERKFTPGFEAMEFSL